MKFRQPIIDLFSVGRCNSEDESTGVTVRGKPSNRWYRDRHGRRKEVTDFIRTVEGIADKSNAILGRSTAGSRSPHPTKFHSPRLLVVARRIPLDWYDPDWFNARPAWFRLLFVDAPIALPLAEDIPDDPTKAPWRGMRNSEFMKKYGNKVKMRYNLEDDEESDESDDPDAYLGGDEGDSDGGGGERRKNKRRKLNNGGEKDKEAVEGEHEEIGEPEEEGPRAKKGKEKESSQEERQRRRERKEAEAEEERQRRAAEKEEEERRRILRSASEICSMCITAD
ncbi:hypothetical protein BDZ89DRAFT_433892 [Hymenopellis radicata]|nr:hypothetical protein BDZ89DRAFT_433892 [Hymenopellis radicata]